VHAASSELIFAPRDKILSRLNKVLVVLIAVGLALPFAYRRIPLVQEKAALDKSLADAETLLVKAQMLNKRLEREVKLLQTNPEYLAIYVRDRVNPGYMEKGETIFRFAPSSQQ
jgi:cell division protein FtsB